jgi:hypothetical protein
MYRLLLLQASSTAKSVLAPKTKILHHSVTYISLGSIRCRRRPAAPPAAARRRRRAAAPAPRCGGSHPLPSPPFRTHVFGACTRPHAARAHPAAAAAARGARRVVGAAGPGGSGALRAPADQQHPVGRPPARRAAAALRALDPRLLARRPGRAGSRVDRRDSALAVSHERAGSPGTARPAGSARPSLPAHATRAAASTSTPPHSPTHPIGHPLLLSAHSASRPPEAGPLRWGPARPTANRDSSGPCRRFRPGRQWPGAITDIRAQARGQARLGGGGERWGPPGFRPASETHQVRHLVTA